MVMAGRLERMEAMLRAQLGDELLERCPDLLYAVNRIALRFGHSAESPAALWHLIDSTLFNTVYTNSQGSMLVRLSGGQAVRVSNGQLTDLADRLLATVYEQKQPTPVLQDILFDLSREGSFAAMRELLARFPLDEMERRYLSQVLKENDQAR